MRLYALISVLCSMSLLIGTGAEVIKVGNSIVDGATRDQPKISYLLDHTFSEESIVFAFSGFYKSKNPVDIQIWRPTNSSGDTESFELVGQWMYSAIKTDRREDFYLESYNQSGSSPCFRVQENDRMGLYFPVTPAAVAYDFAFGNSRTLQLEMTSDPQKGMSFTFDSLSWPYKFSLAAWIDDDLSQYPAVERYPTCRPGLQILQEDEGYVTEAPSATRTPPPQGATGATGPQGATGDTGPKGDQGVMGPKGNDGAQGSPGSMGNPGRDGSQGETGALGTHGSTGATGPLGMQGATGQSGPAGPPGNVTFVNNGGSAGAQTGDDCSWCPKFMNAYLILGVVIWLAVVTLLLVIIMIVVACRKQAKPQYNNKSLYNDNLWKKYENGGFDNEKAKANGDNTYSAIEEGRTAF